MRRVSHPLSLAALLWAGLASAQFQPRLNDLSQLPLHTVPSALVRAKIAGVQAVSQKQGPLPFAVSLPLGLSLADGEWDALDADTLRWRTRVTSQGAQSLHFHFSAFELPPKAELWIYSADGQQQDRYTAEHRAVEGGLWSGPLLSSTAVLELRLPVSEKTSAKLKLDRVDHGFKSYKDAVNEFKSGSCNVDVACSAGDSWRNEIRSVTRLDIPTATGRAFCTGTLVNNVAQDNRPLVLTADHCGIGDTSSPASGVTFVWNFQSSGCGAGGANGDGNDTLNMQTGSTFLDDDFDSDYTIVELLATPQSAFNVYYAGIDANGTVGQLGVSIHHPAGDEKRISCYNTPLTRQRANIAGRLVDAWEVARWDTGTTEQGSSGSGLWAHNRRVVGVLSGGSAACNAAPSSSTDNDQPDYYGRLELAWNAGLSAIIDPANTGNKITCGRNPGDPACSLAGGVALTTACATTGGPAPGGNTEGGGAYGSGALTVQLFLLGLGALTRRLRRRA